MAFYLPRGASLGIVMSKRLRDIKGRFRKPRWLEQRLYNMRRFRIPLRIWRVFRTKD
jgi:hypothetical protein